MEEGRALRADVRERERLAVQRCIEDADVILCTNTGAAAKQLAGLLFEWVVIDEAAQVHARPYFWFLFSSTMIRVHVCVASHVCMRT